MFFSGQLPVFFAAVVAGMMVVSSVGCRPAETFRSGDGAAGFGSAGSAGSGGAGGLPIGVGSGGTEEDAGDGTGGVPGSGGSGGDPGGSGGTGGIGSGGSGGIAPTGSGGQMDAGADRPIDTGVDRGTEARVDMGIEPPVEPRPEPPVEVAPERPVDAGREVIDTGPTINGCLRANWTITANNLCDTPGCAGFPPNSQVPQNAIDGDPLTRYSTGRLQGSPIDDEMVTVDFGDTVTISGLRLVTDNGDGAVAYRVEYSTNGTLWRRFVPDVAGPGGDILPITLPTTDMRAVRVIQTGSSTTNWWSIHELTLTNCVN